jgi:hypothetical protein
MSKRRFPFRFSNALQVTVYFDIFVLIFLTRNTQNYTKNTKKFFVVIFVSFRVFRV